MTFSAFRSTILSASLVMLPLSPVLAQDESQPFGNRDIENIDLSNYYSPPAVYIESITVTETNGRTMKGEVKVLNAATDMVGDIHVRLELLGGLGEGGSPEDVYERGESMAVPALQPEGRYSIPFEYERPLLPAGDFYLRAQIVTSQGREYGWGEYKFEVPPGEAPDLGLRAVALHLPEFPDQDLAPLTGPNVDPSSTFEIEAQAQNNADRDITVTPVLDIYNFDSAVGVIGQVTFEPVTIEAGDPAVLRLPVTADDAAGVSFASLRLMDEAGRQLSPLADFRWVVRGAHAQVMSARLANLATGSGEVVYAFIDFVGAPDAETPVTATLEIVLRDDKGDIAYVQAPDMELTDAIELGRADLRLTRDMVGVPVVATKLSGPAGVTFHTYEIAFGTVKESSFPQMVFLFALAASVLAALGIVLLKSVRISK